MVICILFLLLAVISVLVYAEFINQNKYLFWNLNKFKNIKVIKSRISKELRKRGCVLKSNEFVKTVSKFWFSPTFLFIKNLNVLICGDKIISPMFGELKLNFTITVGESVKQVSFSDFKKDGKRFFLEVAIDKHNCKLSITDDLQFIADIKSTGKEQGKIENLSNNFAHNVKITVQLNFLNGQINHFKSSFKIKSLCVKYVSPNALKEKNKNSIAFNFYTNKTQKFVLKFEILNEHNKIIIKKRSIFGINYYITKRTYLSKLVDKITNEHLSNFEHFNKVQILCQKLQKDYRNLVFFTLFCSSDYLNYKQVLKIVDMYKCCNISPVFFYKNAHPSSKEQGIRFCEYYSVKLSVANFLLSAGVENEINKLQSSELTSNLEQFFNPNTMERYYFFDNTTYINFYEFDNYRKMGNTLKLENSNGKVYYNFSSPFKITNGKLLFAETNICVIVSKNVCKKSYYECIVDRAINESQKTIFIDLWQGVKQLQLRKNIEQAIAKCPAVSLLYALDKPNFYEVFIKFSEQYCDASSKLIMYYYLVKYLIQIDMNELFLQTYKFDIVINLFNCYELSKKCDAIEQKFIIYLHSKNLQKINAFCDFTDLIAIIRNDLESKLPNFGANHPTFNDLIINFEPTLFNYEYLLDILLDIKNGYFRFKNNVCLYDNEFTLSYGNQSAKIHLKGNELKTIHGEFDINENLYLPLNLQGILQELKIY